METGSSSLGLLILRIFKKELIQSNFPNSHILLGNFKWVFNKEPGGQRVNRESLLGHLPSCLL